jgi:mycoketide-CoA synthase
VHAATGGVGTAAVQLATHLGAEVFATTSPPKQGVLRERGFDADHIANSRALDFERAFLESTGGDGVDVVLNSLAHEFVDASLRTLPRGGHFLEMGKTDIRDPEAVAGAHPGVTYQAYDLFAMVETDPDLVREMFAELVALFEGGVLVPPPITVWDVHQAGEAFRQLSQARHIGKMVLTLPAPLDPEGTVLITGGTGTLGGLVARHLVAECGVRHLLLTSRSGPNSDSAVRLLSELKALDVDAVIAACDVSDRAALQELLGSVSPEHPLTGVVHTAGVLDDGTFGSLTSDRLDQVMRPKVDAAWNLHELTRDSAPAMFTMFSSAAGVLGNAGQANYAAANTFLDALAHHRRAQGLPAQSLAWGVWAESSSLTGALDASDRARMARSGVLPLSTEEGLALLDAAAAAGHAVAVPARLDLAALRGEAEGAVVPQLLRAVVGSAVRRSSPHGERAAARLRADLSGRSAAERRQLLLETVRAHAATVLGHSDSSAVGGGQAFKDLGFDSMSVIELRNHLKRVTGLQLSASVVFDHPTPMALAEHLEVQLAPEDEVPGAPVLGELERLQSAALTGELDRSTRSRISSRLKEFLFKLDELGDEGDGAEGGVSQKIDSATDDEIFDFIDNEL